MNYTKRQDKLLKLLRRSSLDAFLVKKRQNISYLVGTKGEDAVLVATEAGNFLISDARHKEEYTSSIRNCRLRITKHKDAYTYIEEISGKARLKRIGFESDSFSYREYTALKKKLKNKRLVPIGEMVESLRMIKDNDELKYIKNACRYGCEIMDYALKTVREPLSEKTIKNRIEKYIAGKGYEKADFDIIVASGKNASMPHARATERNIKKGEMVIIDLGAMNYGYNSDLTRTVFLGRIDRKYSRIYNIVSLAQKKAIEHIKAGVEVKYINNISRRYISDNGLGKYFIHSLGHGIGLEVHERPHVSGAAEAILEKNMVITIEPGVYIPGWGGVRIEDDVLVTEDGCVVLTEGCRKHYAGRN